jgi:hypothetical protein
MAKKILLVLFILFLLFAGFLLYKMIQIKKQPIQTPFVNQKIWKKYTNQEYNITFDYPSNLIINSELHSSNWIQNPNVLYTFNFIDPKTHVIKIIFTIHKSDTLNDLPPNVEKKETFILNNLKIATYEIGNPYEKFIKISRNSDKKIFMFTYTHSLSDDTVITQILSTFKFLDQITPTMMSNTYTCPKSGWIDCMPGPDKDMTQCSTEAMTWYKANCPDFQGGAL